jgi:signal transduction histidine kinase
MTADLRQLEGSPAFLADVLENLHSSIAVSQAVREDGRIVDFRSLYVNRAYEERVNQTRAEISTRTLLQRFPGFKTEGLFDQLVQVVETGQTLDVEQRYQADGLDMHIRLIAKKYGDGVLVQFHDIARRKRSETELKRVNLELEARVGKRTAELRQTQERLQQALEAAQQSNSAKSEFLAMISHDLRSPLTAIQGYASLLESDNLAVGQIEQLRLIDHCAEGLLRLLDDLLRFSRLEAGQFTLQNEPFLLPPLLGETLDIFRPVARQKKLALRLEADPAMPEIVVGDAAQLRRILTNLIGNALKFTECGEVVVRARTTSLPDQSGWELHGEVSDTGPGLDPELLHELFQPYKQGVAETRRGKEGVGLGLAICRRLCESMGGEITADSAPGRGSRFNFHVQLKAVVPED